MPGNAAEAGDRLPAELAQRGPGSGSSPQTANRRMTLRYTGSEQGAPVDQLSLGVIARSRREPAHRLAIHPRPVQRIEPGLRERIYLECGYGEQFGVPDEQLAPCVAGLRTRAQLFAACDVILLPKPQHEDLAQMREGQVLWGWPHCVQDAKITQLSIDQRLTLIAFEAMNHWSADGSFSLHVFHKNNELAGYCSVLHALELIGTTGEYGRRMRAAVISFGATGRGAVTALNAHGVNDVDVLTHRAVNAVASPIRSEGGPAAAGRGHQLRGYWPGRGDGPQRARRE